LGQETAVAYVGAVPVSITRFCFVASRSIQQAAAGHVFFLQLDAGKRLQEWQIHRIIFALHCIQKLTKMDWMRPHQRHHFRQLLFLVESQL
jgi:hypothetical protein